nr:PREDICTED: CD44 antigen-like [Equus przewalskii]
MAIGKASKNNHLGKHSGLKSNCAAPKTAVKRREAQDLFSWWFQPSESKNFLHTTTRMAGNELIISFHVSP